MQSVRLPPQTFSQWYAFQPNYRMKRQGDWGLPNQIIYTKVASKDRAAGFRCCLWTQISHTSQFTASDTLMPRAYAWLLNLSSTLQKPLLLKAVCGLLSGGVGVAVDDAAGNRVGGKVGDGLSVEGVGGKQGMGGDGGDGGGVDGGGGGVGCGGGGGEWGWRRR